MGRRVAVSVCSCADTHSPGLLTRLRPLPGRAAGRRVCEMRLSKALCVGALAAAISVAPAGRPPRCGGWRATARDSECEP